MDNQVLKNKPSKSSSGLRRLYLLTYNGVSLTLWSVLTLQGVIAIFLSQNELHTLHDTVFDFLKYTQTIAILEIVHALIGLVRAGLLTTFIQVVARLIVLWGVVGLYPVVSTTDILGRSEPGAIGAPAAFAGMLMAWGVAEVVRYGYFVWREGISDEIPFWLTWLRYSLFFVLYPIGITSEWWLVYQSLPSAAKGNRGYYLFLRVGLLLYVPASYIMYTHMMAQRRRVLGSKSKAG